MVKAKIVTVKPQTVTDERVKRMVERMLIPPELKFARAFTVTYQARTLLIGAD
jgi:hypothetical protein